MQVFSSVKGFTLVELLISLAILGEIATFTIPKILTSQSNGTKLAVSKEDISIISGAFSQFKLLNTVSTSSEFGNMVPYINYAKLNTSGTIFNGSWNCTASAPCLVMHNGSNLAYTVGESFSALDTSHVIHIVIDPGGNTAYGPDGVDIFLFPNGRITEQAALPGGSVSSSLGSYGWTGYAGYTPAWFHW